MVAVAALMLALVLAFESGNIRHGAAGRSSPVLDSISPGLDDEASGRAVSIPRMALAVRGGGTLYRSCRPSFTTWGLTAERPLSRTFGVGLSLDLLSIPTGIRVWSGGVFARARKPMLHGSALFAEVGALVRHGRGFEPRDLRTIPLWPAWSAGAGVSVAFGRGISADVSAGLEGPVTPSRSNGPTGEIARTVRVALTRSF